MAIGTLSTDAELLSLKKACSPRLTLVGPIHTRNVLANALDQRQEFIEILISSVS